MPPVKLSDAELTAVFAAAAPLPVECRDAFLQQVATSLGGYPELGPGIVHRVCAETQRQFFDPPEFTNRETGVAAKYR